MKFIPLLIATLLLAASANADIVNLTDGTKVEGKIQKTDEGWTVTRKDGSTVTISADKVASIQASRVTDDAVVAADRLASLRRVVEHLSDISDIISRYNTFIERTTDQAAVDGARKDLQMWHDRLDQGMVKLGDTWITGDERQRRREQAQTEAMPARDLISNYRYKEADKILQQAITDDPESASALYLQGVMLYKQQQVAQARKSFETVNQLVPNHAPTLNNLAVISWRQKSYVIAMNFYDEAMMSTPQAKEILDNVAEALNAIPPENRKAPVVLLAAKLFAEQDQVLQAAAAQQGMYRWGATWVTAKQLDELKAAEAKVKQQLADLQSQFDVLQTKMGQIDSEVGQNNREMARLEADQAANTYADKNGRVYQMPLPDVYYTMQRDNVRLAADKQAVQQQQDLLKKKAKDVEQGIPVPKFTGIQEIIGVDAMPVRAGPGPTTTPSQANN